VPRLHGVIDSAVPRTAIGGSHTRAPQGESARDVFDLDAAPVVAVGESARDPADRLHGAGGQVALLGGPREHRAQVAAQRREFVELIGVEFGIGALALARTLDLPRASDALGEHVSRALAARIGDLRRDRELVDCRRAIAN